jgi:recombination protein RecA
LPRPFAEAEFEILYNQGINKEGNILDVGLTYGVVEKKGAWLQFSGELIGQGKEAAQKTLAEKPELAQKILDAILTKRAELAALDVNGLSPLAALNKLYELQQRARK